MPRSDPRTALPIPARLSATARDAWQGQITRRLVGTGHVADTLTYRPASFDVGSTDKADAMLRGHFDLAGATARVERADPWRVDAPSAAWSAALHGFDWLKHFRAGDGPASRSAARRFVDGWLHRHGSSAGFAWRPAITGARVTAWIMSARLLMENAEPTYRSAFLKSLGIQGRYLAKTAPSEADPMDRMGAAMGMLYVGLCLPGHEKLLPEGLKIFVKAAAAASLPDGGPASHDPMDLAERLSRLIQVRSDLQRAGKPEVAERLTPMIATATPILRMLRHGDGGLGLFHGGYDPGAEALNRILVDSGEGSAPATDAPDTGYLRLAAGRMTVLMDAGSTPTGRHARTAHAAPLAIEVSAGQQRLIVNCGSGVHMDAEWEAGCRVSAAHSTLTLADQSPAQFTGSTSGSARRLVGAPQVFERVREEDEDGIWALAGHDGYAARYGLLHYRRLFMGPDGTDLRGEDTLSLVKGGRKALSRARARHKSPDGPVFAVRFHLHPSVSVEVEDKGAVLTLADGARWRMLASGGTLAVEDSIYLPRPAAPKATKQIAIHAAVADDEGQVRWALKRLDAVEPL